MLAPGEIFGGAERQILLLLSHLAGGGHSAYLLCFHDRELAARARALGIPTLVLAARPALSLRNARLIGALLAREQIPVLHVHGYKAAAHALLARRHAAFSVVRTEHGGMEAQNANPLRNLKPRLFRAVENLATRLLRGHVVYVTRDLARQAAQQHAGVASSVIVNGVEPIGVHAPPPELARGAGHWNAVVVGRLEPVKGIEFAIRALANACVPQRVRLWIVGDGPLRAELESLARSLLPEGRVHFAGFRRDAVSFIANADALLMPSLHEGLPYTLLEAIGAGVPVVASDVGGLAEVLVNERSALLVPVGDVAKLATAIARLATDQGLARALASHATETVGREHTAQKMGDAYLELYRSLNAD
jgi:glycosyltransferase involved in cell wall biosynthesis